MGKDKKVKTYSNSIFYAFFLLVMVLILIVFVVLHFVTSGKAGEGYYELGGAVDGLTAPFIGISAAVLTFLAFRMQIDANNQVKEQFKLQQFESQFFKFLDIYVDVVDRIKYQSRYSNQYYEGKSYFYLLHLEFRDLLEDIKRFNSKFGYSQDSIVIPKYSKELIELDVIKKEEDISIFSRLEITYVILYYGVGVTGRMNIRDTFENRYQTDYIKSLVNYLSNKPKEKEGINFAMWSGIFDMKDFKKPNNDKFTRFYNGHQSRLGHYYRQLFGAISYANKQESITYLDKWDYVRHFRSLFSTYEQLMLFLNSISVLGRSWELEVKDIGEKNEVNILNKGLITKYDLIKNIPAYQINEYEVKKFYPNVDFDGYTKERTRFDNEVYQ
ncbi:putative phage abortive infection protein [Myroides marinus]|uniref:putative phage abortive infection protein n=1 Tax=Myroides marinus TaxID=703342 RepID=UPI0025768179|nr:putative phage abortive infection protein [Myroides marinus]MDM1378649.1 hypothetical protein [Myroides marinus]MDM1385920.1 hypothetical protein [Myroides marinus]MDM1393133.1 hypothetical protein [Myroides marinus]